MTNAADDIFGISTQVHYIYAPSWTSASAGIRALHYLCHAMNQNGFSSFLVLADSQMKNNSPVSGYLNTPVLTPEISQAHSKAGRQQIVFYSETVPGNPLNAPYVVRYLMNYIGDLGGQVKFEDTEFLLSYSANIARDFAYKSGLDTPPEVLFLPAVDPNEFTFNTEMREDFYLLYAGKYRAFKGIPPKFADKKIIEIFRQGSKAQSRSEVIDLLARCRAVISLENSSIITEAVLSGTPGLFYPNDFLKEAIAEVELGWGGTGWGIGDSIEANARRTLELGRISYYEQIEKFSNNLTIILTHIHDHFDKDLSTHRLEYPEMPASSICTGSELRNKY